MTYIMLDDTNNLQRYAVSSKKDFSEGSIMYLDKVNKIDLIIK